MRTTRADDWAGPGLGTRSLVFLRHCRSSWHAFLERLSTLGRWAWPLTIAVAFIYLACFANFIDRHTSLPFWDGWVYVQKTTELAEKFHAARLFERLNPTLYLDGLQPGRPPLVLAIAAIVLGPNPAHA